jgi:hypothetical protein
MITALPLMVRYQMSSGTATQTLRSISGKEESERQLIKVTGKCSLLLVHKVTRACLMPLCSSILCPLVLAGWILGSIREKNSYQLTKRICVTALCLD